MFGARIWLALLGSAFLHGALLLQAARFSAAAEPFRPKTRLSLRLAPKPLPEAVQVPPEPTPEAAAAPRARRTPERAPRPSSPAPPPLPAGGSSAERGEAHAGSSEGAAQAPARKPALDLELHALPGAAPPDRLVPPPPADRSGDDFGSQRRGPEAGWQRDSAFAAKVDRHGQLEFMDANRIEYDAQRTKREGFTFRLGLTEMLMAVSGRDAAQYEKQKFAARSQKWRAELAREAREEDLSLALLTFRERLEAGFADPSATLADRQRWIFDLWDECVEEGDRDTLRVSRSVRKILIDFVQRRLPEHSISAYSTEALVALNRRRRSNAYFSPYGPWPETESARPAAESAARPSD